jgi:uncharacterized protein YndB with AHSA1/START domain
MSMTSHGSVKVAAPAAEVFRWLVEPDKLTQWAGGAGAMPADPSLLKAGFTASSMVATPGGPRPATLTVTDYQPPTSFGFTIGYDGGQTVTIYRLSEAGRVTTLDCDGTSDFAAVDLSAVESQVASQPWLIRWFVHHELQHSERMLKDGAFDAQTQPYLQAALQQSLDRLATLISPAATG